MTILGLCTLLALVLVTILLLLLPNFRAPAGLLEGKRLRELEVDRIADTVNVGFSSLLAVFLMLLWV